MKKEIKKIKRKQLPALIKKFCQKGARPLTVTLCTIKDLTKKQQEALKASELIKVSTLRTFLNFDYGSAVNRQREREGKEVDFKPKSTFYIHKESDPRPIVRHKQDDSKLYLQLKVEKKVEEVFFNHDGKRFDPEYIKEVIGAKKVSKSQGVEKQIVTIAPALDSIRRLVCDNEEYEVVD